MTPAVVHRDPTSNLVDAESNPDSPEIALLRADYAAAQRLVGELTEAVAARDAFIGTAGHELRNAMGGILVATSNLHTRVTASPGLPPWVVDRLETITRLSRTFVRRATTLLDVSRLSSSKPQLTCARVDLAELLRAIVEELGPEAERAECQVQVTADDVVTGWWDRDALEQVLVNLLSNAIKYGAGKPIHVWASVSGPTALVRVRDHGVGISEVDQERIFARFERAVRRSDHPGFGMGLWIARQLVHAHAGQIEVQSVLGVGSTFTVRIPGVLHGPNR